MLGFAGAIMMDTKLDTTVNMGPCALLLATVTESGPVVAPAGTVARRVVLVAEVTVAIVPLNWTVSFAGVGSNPWPWIVTCVPTEPVTGVILKIARVPRPCEEGVTDVIFPDASYV